MANHIATTAPKALPKQQGPQTLPPGHIPAPEPMPPEIERHLAVAEAWQPDGGIWDPDKGQGALLPLPAISELRAELERRAQPATSKYQLAVLVGMLAGFPQRQPDHAEAYLGALIEETSDYSDDALYWAAREVRRTLRFLPTPAEFREIAAHFSVEQACVLYKLERMERRHQEQEAARRLQQLYDGAISTWDVREAAERLGRMAGKFEQGVPADAANRFMSAIYGAADGAKGSPAALELCKLVRYRVERDTGDIARVVELIGQLMRESRHAE